MWVRAWVQRRKMEGCCQKLLKELRSEEPSLHKNSLGFNDLRLSFIVWTTSQNVAMRFVVVLLDEGADDRADSVRTRFSDNNN